MRSQLIQKLDTQVGADVSARRCVEVFLAGGTITSGDWVAFDTTKTNSDRVLYVIQAANVALGNTLVVGVALESTTVGLPVRVCVEGYVEGANVASAVTSGEMIVVDTTAGRGHAAATGDLSICGVALENAASNTCDVWVIRRV